MLDTCEGIGLAMGFSGRRREKMKGREKNLEIEIRVLYLEERERDFGSVVGGVRWWRGR